MRKVFFVIAVLLIIDLTLQFYFAAFGVFSNPSDEQFALHATNGRIVLPVLAILLIISAALARAGGRTIGYSVWPFGLIAFQTVLFILTGALTGSSEENVTLAGSIMLGFHALVGLTAFLVTGMIIGRARRLMMTGSTTSGPRLVEHVN